MLKPFYTFAGLVVLAVVLVGAAPATQPEIRRGMPVGGTEAERSRRYFDRLVAAAEPTGHPDPARLTSYLATLKRELVRDPRLIAFAPTAEAQSTSGAIRLRGYAEYPELKSTAERFFRTLGFPTIDDQIELLPSAGLGDRPYAIVTAAKAFLYDKPRAPHESLTQALVGDGLFLLKREDDFYLCHSAVGYLGYVAAADVMPVETSAFAEALAAPHVTLVEDVKDGSRFAPAGAHLRLVSTSGPSVEVAWPTGGALRLSPNQIFPAQEAPAKLEKVIAQAYRMMGTPYVWGGRTSEGIDCSGLIQSAFQSQGILLPRDADQQALCGTLVATRGFRAALRRGDLLFFVSARGTIHHVAIYLGQGRFLEAATPGVKISSFNPGDKNYAPKRDASFAFAKRVLD